MADWTSSVRSYLRSVLAGISGLPAVAYEGRPYEPVVGQRWLREQLIPVNAPVETLGNYGQVREDFLYRLTLFSPLVSATGADGRLSSHEDLIDTIRATFHPGATIRDLDSTIFGQVVQANRGMTMTEADWISTPINITAYFHRATRAA